jgi:hypothetical protein
MSIFELLGFHGYPGSGCKANAHMKNGTVRVEDVEYHWSIYRQPRWTGTGVPLGLAILVKAANSGGRELILEFAMGPTRHGDVPQPQRLRVSNRRLIECIQNARNAGWDPDTRGKFFFFDAGPVNPN